MDFLNCDVLDRRRGGRRHGRSGHGGWWHGGCRGGHGDAGLGETRPVLLIFSKSKNMLLVFFGGVK